MYFLKKIILVSHLALLTTHTLGSSAFAQDLLSEWQIIGIKGGFEASYGYCPCYRWSVNIAAFGGEIETREFIFSSEGLFELKQTLYPVSNRRSAESFQAGEMEVLWKKRRLGLAFEGVSWGRDEDQSYDEMFQTGLHIFMALIHTDEFRFDVRSGYEYESFRVNRGPKLKHHLLVQSLHLEWWSEKWETNLSVSIAFEPELDDLFKPHLTANAGIYRKILSKKDFHFALGFEAGFERDPIREIFGMEPNQTLGNIVIDLRWAREQQ
jgi:hypothetical protein